jgi:hypothetical protein
MHYVTECYKCGHFLVFNPGQKTVLCRRCNRKLECSQLKKQRLHKVTSLAKASLAIGYLESKGKKLGFKTYKTGKEGVGE